MTLTEQWKKGELKEGWYYIRNKAHSIKFNQMAFFMVFGEVSYWTNCKDEDVEEVLAPIPNYEEYSRLKWYAGCGPDRIVELNKENRQLRKWCEEFNTLDIAKENQQLKDLLKECRDYLEDDSPLSMRSMIEEIDNAIGEK